MITLDKDRLYYPDFLVMTVRNTGNTDIDLDRPLLVFSDFWMKRKFRINGTNKYTFYPLYLGVGETHDLRIDLNYFYRYDRKLKKYPKTKIVVFNVKGKRLAEKSVFLRKTLFR